jgi:N-acetylneuraminic acid mutarotase
MGDLPTATVLADGKVLVTYNFGGGASVLFDPVESSWESPANMANWHLFGATATSLGDGRVLVVGGVNSPSPAGATMPPEIYDPASNTWSSAGTMNSNRVAHVAALLPNGKVLVAGGRSDYSHVLASAEIYDGSTNTWSPAADMPTERANAGAVVLPQGQVLVIGGEDGTGVILPTPELYW